MSVLALLTMMAGLVSPSTIGSEASLQRPTPLDAPVAFTYGRGLGGRPLRSARAERRWVPERTRRAVLFGRGLGGRPLAPPTKEDPEPSPHPDPLGGLYVQALPVPLHGGARGSASRRLASGRVDLSAVALEIAPPSVAGASPRVVVAIARSSFRHQPLVPRGPPAAC
jgi:hypothetical protein